ncbi:hypothetical protein M405DRAFT_909902 [Rhizopogon salebrosus TDB-379]|nr:hypothetical protein M405DRAFT_909902 [Rhizopogon salebrosus TDB-379]
MNWEHGGKGVKAGTIADACTQCATVKKRCSPPVDSDDAAAAAAASTPPPTLAAPKAKNTRAKSQATTAKSKTTKSAKPSRPTTKSKAKSKSRAKSVDVVMDDHTGTTSATGSIVAAAASEDAEAGAAGHATDVDMGPVPTTDTAEDMSLENISFTVRPMEVDAAEFAEAGFSSADNFATAGDFKSGQFEDPAEEGELASRTVARQTTPPTNASIDAIIAAVRHQIQVLRAGDHEEIQHIRHASQVTSNRLDYAETRVQEAMYAKLSVEQDDNKIVLNNLVNGMADFLRYFTDVQLSGPDRQYTNPPSVRQLAQEILPDIFSNLSSHALTGPGNFDSASHAGPSQTPISCRPASNILPRTRQTASNILPQTKQISGTQRAKLPRAASAMVTQAQSSQKGKGKGKEKAQDDEDYIVDDPDAEGEEDDDIENAEWEDDCTVYIIIAGPMVELPTTQYIPLLPMGTVGPPVCTGTTILQQPLGPPVYLVQSM